MVRADHLAGPKYGIFENLLAVDGTGDRQTVIDVGERPGLVLEHERPVRQVEDRLDLERRRQVRGHLRLCQKPELDGVGLDG